MVYNQLMPTKTLWCLQKYLYAAVQSCAWVFLDNLEIKA